MNYVEARVFCHMRTKTASALERNMANKKKKHTKSNRSPDHTAAAKKKMAMKKAPAKKAAPKKKADGKSQSVSTEAFELEGLAAHSGGQSGDLQGLSNIAGADSESVDELLEEGNAFEADVVKGVQDAGDADEGEVRSHEAPEDDVPKEYFRQG
jgi:hypothetical protein